MHQGETFARMQCDIYCERERIENLIRQTIWSAGAEGIVVGVSGGIDSAVALALSCGAVGKERVSAFFLPGETTPPGDEEDVHLLCTRFGLRPSTIPITGIIQAYRSTEGFVEDPQATGNLMARTRMVLLYYHANMKNYLVMGTSNRTEYLIGYCTKWGDNAADIQPLLHLYKNQVCLLADILSIPESIQRKKPSAGLWRDQTDEEEIGMSYTELDSALSTLEENDWKAETDLEERVLSMVRKSAHKRIAPPNLAGLYPRSP